jgi:hypothetical protein
MHKLTLFLTMFVVVVVEAQEKDTVFNKNELSF